MKIATSVLAAAALIAASAVAVKAQQTPPAAGQSAGKVYSYKKTAAPTPTPGINTDYAPEASRTKQPFQFYYPETAPTGSTQWWQEINRTNGGGDGGGGG